MKRKRWIPVAILVVACLALSTRFAGSSRSREPLFNSENLASSGGEVLKATTVTPHLEAPIAPDRNLLWCGTFQLVWNETCTLIGEDVHFATDPPMVAPMNRKAFTRDAIDDASYVAIADFVRNDPFGQIAKALKQKFRGQAAPRYLPDPSSAPRPQDIIAYAYLFKHLEFPMPFERLEQPMKFQETPVAGFGLGPYKPQHHNLYPQISILDYTDPDHFVIELKSKSAGDRLILAKMAPAATLAQTVAQVAAQMSATKAINPAAGDVLAVPRISFDITRKYSELYGHFLVATNPTVAKDLGVTSAIQNIRFEMDEKGVRLESESHMSIGCAAEGPPPKPEHIMIFDKPFLVLMQRGDAKTPYFALWVGHAELLMPAKP